MFMKPKVAEIIKRRIDAGLSKRQLSISAGLGSSSICRIENGITIAIHPLRAKAIAKALGCKVTDIFEKQ